MSAVFKRKLSHDDVFVSSKGIHWIMPDFRRMLHQGRPMFFMLAVSYRNRKWNIQLSHETITVRGNKDDWLSMAVFHGRFIPDEYIVEVGITDEFNEYIVSCRTNYVLGGAYSCRRLCLFSELFSHMNEYMPDGKIRFLVTVKECISSIPSQYISDANRIRKYKQAFKSMLQDGDMTDIVLKVQGQEFRAHRCILAARSPVFLAMFSHGMRENLTGVVDIEDIDSNIFCDFLYYLYTAELENFTVEKAFSFLSISEKYQINDLKEKCLFMLSNNISVDNFCDIRTLSFQLNNNKLKNACIKFFRKKTSNVVVKANWKTFLSEKQ